MGLFGGNKERERFYLLPGMGGRALRRKHKRILVWSMVAGLGVSLVLAYILWLLNHRTPGS
jgi:type VI protein secretion system component VasF